MIYHDAPPDFAAMLLAAPAPTPPGGRRPRTPRQEHRAGKLLRHLIDPPVVAEDAALLEAQARDINGAFQPRNGWQDWLTTTIGTTIARLNRCERVERKLRDVASYRAIDFWEDDQQLAAETLALKLPKQPGRTVVKLMATPAGVDWLMARWRFLAGVAPDAWTDAQRELAVQMVGADPTIDPCRPGFAQARLDELVRRRERAVELDAIQRGLVEADLSDDVPGLATLRRQARALHRQLKWYVDQFHVEHPDRWDDPMRRPATDRVPADAFRPPNRDHIEGEGAATADEVGNHLWSGQPRPPGRATAALAAERAREEAAAEAEAAAQLVDDQTNRVAEIEIDQTNRPAPAPVRASFAIEPPPFVRDYSNETGRNHSRPRRPGETSREYARRQDRARRRTNLALAELL